MMDAIIQSLNTYYGLDWGALCFGMVGCFLVTNQNRFGFLFSMCGCFCGFGVAILSQQYGFIVYNIILVSLQTRGFVRWGQKQAVAYAETRSTADRF